MSLTSKILLITFIFGVPAYFLGKIIWPISSSYETPSVSQYPLMSLLSFFEALMFGLGVSFLIFGWGIIKHLPLKTIRVIIYASIAWLLLSWWPHDSLHLYMGSDLNSQIILEHVFHIPTMLAQVCLIFAFLALLQSIISYKSEENKSPGESSG